MKQITINSIQDSIGIREDMVSILRPIVKKHFRPAKLAYLQRSAYGIKHDMERYFENVEKTHQYVAEPEFIKAMLLEGFKAYEKEGQVFFNIYKTDCDVLRLICFNSAYGGRPIEIKNRINKLYPEFLKKYDITYYEGTLHAIETCNGRCPSAV